jgi:hypothetical protein
MKNDKPTTLIWEPEDDTGIIGGEGRSFAPETVKHIETLIIQDGAKGLAMNVFFFPLGSVDRHFHTRQRDAALQWYFPRLRQFDRPLS